MLTSGGDSGVKTGGMMWSQECFSRAQRGGLKGESEFSREIYSC